MTRNETGDLALVHNSNWATNIGNPFFSLGVVYALRRALDDHRVLCTDQLSGLAWRPSRAQHQRDIKYPQYSEADWFVLSGPMLNKRFIEYYDDILASIPDDTKLILLSAGGIRYDEAERELVRDFLRRQEPDILFTRDEVTYERYNDLATHSYSGIDFGFFAPDYYEGYPTPRLSPYVTFTFDSNREPDVSLQNVESNPSVKVGRSVLDVLPHRIVKYIPERCPERINEYTVVRPTHKTARIPRYLLYKRQNTFFSQTPYGYLNVYRNTELAVSDRLHGAVATLAYGNPARLVSDSPRVYLFERLGMGEITDEVVHPDEDAIAEEKEAMVEELSAIETI